MGKAAHIAAIIVALAMAGSEQLQAAEPALQDGGSNGIARQRIAQAPAPQQPNGELDANRAAPAAEALSEGAASAERPESFVSLKLEGACDERNNRLWLTNTHTFKTVATTVRWRAAGGKALTDQFFPGPNSVREIGCAAEGEIIQAEFADF